MLKLMIQLLLSVFAVYGAYSIVLGISRELFSGNKSRIRIALIGSDGDIDFDLAFMKKYFGLKRCVIIPDGHGKTRYAEMIAKDHPGVEVFSGRRIK